jgi:hypothetical protein
MRDAWGVSLKGDHMSQLNFVETRALREETLEKNIGNVWNEARSKLQECCESFKKHCPGERLQLSLENNGDKLVVRRTFSVEDVYRGGPRDQPMILTVTFVKEERCIEVKTDSKSPVKYLFDADTEKVILKSGNKEISLDEFSEKVLSEALKQLRRMTARQ